MQAGESFMTIGWLCAEPTPNTWYGKADYPCADKQDGCGLGDGGAGIPFNYKALFKSAWADVIPITRYRWIGFGVIKLEYLMC